MSKRKLTRRQAWRIEKIQAERSKRAGQQNERVDQQLNEGELGPEQQGLVIAHYGNQVDIEPIQVIPIKIEPTQTEAKITPQVDDQVTIHRCHLRANLGSLVTGDKVIWREGKPTGVVVATQARKSELSRPDMHGQLRPIAANVDYIVIVIAPIPEPHPNLVDRYLVAAESVDIEPLILLNKIDLLDADNRVQIDELLELYPQINYQVLQASSKRKDGLSELKAILKDRTSVFVGQSGVGKSSLINALLPGVDIKEGELSKVHATGMHTTTTAKLFHVPEGGDLIDSPGVREFGLWHMEREQVLDGFIEFRPFLGNCKFRDCMHQHEPGCELLAALERGDISERRLNSFESIANSLAKL